jgi:hypothetical protein
MLHFLLNLTQSTRPDLCYATTKLCSVVTTPTTATIRCAEHILVYLWHTRSLTLSYAATPTDPVDIQPTGWPADTLYVHDIHGYVTHLHITTGVNLSGVPRRQSTPFISFPNINPPPPTASNATALPPEKDPTNNTNTTAERSLITCDQQPTPSSSLDTILPDEDAMDFTHHSRPIFLSVPTAADDPQLPAFLTKRLEDNTFITLRDKLMGHAVETIILDDLPDAIQDHDKSRSTIYRQRKKSGTFADQRKKQKLETYLPPPLQLLKERPKSVPPYPCSP